ncbi:DNA-binding protein [Variovorax sp. SRS16]|uniref:DNA-binding protein n=1 Tax=Variovorax sp. SRS16 TaxID=282217 RepID=UPI0022B29A83|nr:DNA-binding protein [Variovorax sp. SRS16]
MRSLSFKAADVLLSEGLRPTIERVRQKIGRGSPNTVSPMLERWFASLGQRIAGGTNPSANLAAGNDADGVPVSVRNATRLLWETARREAEEVQRGELESVRAELQERGNALAEAQAALVQREDAFAQARVRLRAGILAAGARDLGKAASGTRDRGAPGSHGAGRRDQAADRPALPVRREPGTDTPRAR